MPLLSSEIQQDFRLRRKLLEKQPKIVLKIQNFSKILLNSFT